jgi:hypothetical protein
MSIPVNEALAHYPEILDELDTLDDTGIDEIKDSILLAVDQHDRLAVSYVEEVWVRINRYASESWVDQERLTQEIEAIEKKYAKLA